jgi:hypothetical protein
MNSQRNQWSSWVTRWLQCTLKLSYIHLGIYIRSTSSLYSTSTPQIVAHWRHYLKSRFDLRVFSNRHLFQILRSMADLLLSNRRPFQNKELYVLLSCHMMDVGQVCKASFLTWKCERSGGIVPSHSPDHHWLL